MTSASKVGFVSVLAMFLVATVLSFGAFATSAHAQEDYNGGYFETGGDVYDEYFTPYGNDTYDEYFTPYGSDTYDEYFSPNGSDTYDEYFSPNGSDTYDEYFSPYGSDTYDEYFSPNDDVQDFYGEDTTYEYTDEYGVKYSSEEYTNESGYSYGSQSSYGSGSSYGGGSSFGGGSGGGFKVSTPQYSFPKTQSYPTPSYPAPRPQPPVHTSAGSNTHVNTNTCTYGSCNTNVNNIDNSINGSFNQNIAPLTPVYSLPPQQLIQYVAPPVAGGYCVITASPTLIQNGQATVLSWTSNGPGQAWLSDGIGHVTPNGTLVARPNVSTNYTLTVNGPQGPRTCNVFVQVSGSYVSLTQIPYTGFDLGTFGNAAYWAGLLSFALAAAYLVVYYQGGMGSLVPSFAGSVKLPKLSLPKLAAAKREEETTETLASPAMFNKNVATRAIAPVKVAVRELDNLPTTRMVNAPKDAMTHDNGRIVVSRN